MDLFRKQERAGSLRSLVVENIRAIALELQSTTVGAAVQIVLIDHCYVLILVIVLIDVIFIMEAVL